MDIESFLKDDQALIAIGILALVVIVFFVGVLMKLRRSAMVEKDGVAGSAVVRGLRETGRVNNRTPEIEIHLDVTLPGHQPYEVAKIVSLPMIYYPRVQPGMTVEVIVHPDHKHDGNYLGLRFHDKI